MRIAFIVCRFPAPSQTFILDQVTGLLDRGHQVDIFPTYVDQDENVHPDVRTYNLMSRLTPKKSIPEKRGEKLGKALRTLWPAFSKDPALTWRAGNLFYHGRKSLQVVLLAEAFAGKEPYHIIHAHHGSEGITVLPLRKILSSSPPLVTSFYGLDLSCLVWNKGKDYYKRLFQESELLLPLSRDFEKRLIQLGCPPEKIRIQPLCIRLSKFRFRERKPPEDGVIRILSVARLVEKKGLEYALHALALFKRHRPGVKFIYRIIGEGPCRDKLLSLRQELGLEDEVELLGVRSHREVPEFFDESHLFLLPSVKAANGDEEGTPVSLMEAMASGMPVVSTFHSGIPEVVEHGKTGFLVPERDPEALAQKLIRLVDSPDRWAKMGKAGREKIEKEHDREAVAERLEKLYRELVKDK